MPYTKQEDRDRVHETGKMDRPGDFAYAITRLVEEYRQQHGDSYDTFIAIRGGLEAASQEFERIVVTPYERHKLIENGPVLSGAGILDPVKPPEERCSQKGCGPVYEKD